MKIIKLSAIDSTNSYLKDLSREITTEDELIVVAERQLNGRGQLKAHWQSEAGKSLTFSLFKRFDNVTIKKPMSISFAVSLAIKKALDSLEIPEISIKWPNDILSYNKKVCGILIENQLQRDNITSSIIGIGVNVNESEMPNLPQASSLHIITGKIYDLNKVLAHVSEFLLKELKSLEHQTPEELKSQYEASLFKKDVVSTFEDETGNLSNGIIRGVNLQGELLVEGEAGSLQKFQHKEIKLKY